MRSRIQILQRHADNGAAKPRDGWLFKFGLRKSGIAAAILIGCVASLYAYLQIQAYEASNQWHEAALRHRFKLPLATTAVPLARLAVAPFFALGREAQSMALPVAVELTDPDAAEMATAVVPLDRNAQLMSASPSAFTMHRPSPAAPARLLPAVDPDVLAAYQAYRAGNNTVARTLYQQVLRTDRRNIDALLGMAAIARQEKDDAAALDWYAAIIAVDPQNSVAQAAMIAIQGEPAAVGSESRVKILLRQQPHAAYLHALLGSLYAGRRQWADAQQAYFNAYRLDSGNAGYAFNLAISLDHLGQWPMALGYYQRAQTLLSTYVGSTIDSTRLQARIAELQRSTSH
jgi:tetratricopeptide (TPR) repeat protein